MTSSNRQESRFDYDCFLSHNSADKPRVCKPAQRLKDAGLRVWFDEWVIGPGDDNYLAIGRRHDASWAEVLCPFPAAPDAGWLALQARDRMTGPDMPQPTLILSRASEGSSFLTERRCDE